MSEKPQAIAGAIDLAEAAERLGLSLKTMQVIVEHGILNGFQDADGRWKVALDVDGGLSTAPDVRAAREQAAVYAEPRRAEPFRTSREPAAAQPARSPEPPPVQPAPHPPPPPPPPSAAQPVPPPAQPAAPAPPQPVPPPVAPAPPPGPSPMERMLIEQIEYLRALLEKREKALVEKDVLIGELMVRLTKISRTAVRQVGGEPVLRNELDRAKAEQSKLREKHEHAMRNIGDVLASVRDYLSRQKKE